MSLVQNAVDIFLSTPHRRRELGFVLKSSGPLTYEEMLMVVGCASKVKDKYQLMMAAATNSSSLDHVLTYCLLDETPVHQGYEVLVHYNSIHGNTWTKKPSGYYLQDVNVVDGVEEYMLSILGKGREKYIENIVRDLTRRSIMVDGSWYRCQDTYNHKMLMAHHVLIGSKVSLYFISHKCSVHNIRRTDRLSRYTLEAMLQGMEFGWLPSELTEKYLSMCVKYPGLAERTMEKIHERNERISK